MGIHPKHLAEYVIRPSLKPLGLYSLEAEQLLLGTAAVESQLGFYLHQIKGPALGNLSNRTRHASGYLGKLFAL